MSIFDWPMERYVLLAIVVCCGWTAAAMHRWDRRHPQQPLEHAITGKFR